MSDFFNVNFTIPLAPVPQKRHRFLKNSYRVYDPSFKDKKVFVEWIQENILNVNENNFQNYNENYNEIYKPDKVDGFLPEKSPNFYYSTSVIEIQSQLEINKIIDFFPIFEPLKIDIYFNLKRPKNHYLKSGLNPKYRDVKPKRSDIDNYIKYIFDVLQPVKNINNYSGLINNDSQIYKITGCKRFLNSPDKIPNINLRLYN